MLVYVLLIAQRILIWVIKLYRGKRQKFFYPKWRNKALVDYPVKCKSACVGARGIGRDFRWRQHAGKEREKINPDWVKQKAGFPANANQNKLAPQSH